MEMGMHEAIVVVCDKCKHKEFFFAPEEKASVQSSLEKWGWVFKFGHRVALCPSCAKKEAEGVHFFRGEIQCVPWAWCGRIGGYPKNFTCNPRQVTCQKCRETQEFKDAMARIAKEDGDDAKSCA